MTASPDTPPGWSTDLLAKARAYSSSAGSTAVVVVQHGRVVVEWGETARKSDIASIRKSLLSSLLGIAITENKVRIDDTLASLGIDDVNPSLTMAEKQATLADLMTSRSGVYHPIDMEPPAVAAQRPARGSMKPGTFWYYNNWDFNALGTIYKQATGEGIFASFKRRISDRIGLRDFLETDGWYGESKLSRHRNYAFRMTARDLAQFGLLYLQGGRWQCDQVLPAAWVSQSDPLCPFTTRSFLAVAMVSCGGAALPASGRRS